MGGPKPWFLVMRPVDANQPGSGWMRQGAVARGKVVARPIAWEGWAALAAFVVLLVAAPLVGFFTMRSEGLWHAIGSAIGAAAVVVAGFVAVARARTKGLNPDTSGESVGPD